MKFIDYKSGVGDDLRRIFPGITNEQIDAKIRVDYASHRERMYPKVGEQLDAIYRDDVVAWRGEILAVKSAFGKPIDGDAMLLDSLVRGRINISINRSDYNARVK